jgi:serine/threonine-protein kinase
LEGEIARGGMGVVYRGVHVVLGDVVAIKAIFPELMLNPELRDRFMAEAQIQYKLHHPNIVQLREFLIEEGKFYIVMELVEGETLAHLLRKMRRPMTASGAVEVFCQALEGLGFAHAHGVIHRDIKPSNIMLTRAGTAKLTDFGIARRLDASKLTRTGTVMGTPAYMSPEQIQGLKVDARADIYSMGVTLYEMLTGRVPFERSADADSDYPVLTAHINQAPLPPRQLVPGIPPGLEAAMLKAMEKRPEHRFASCQEFRQAIVAPPSPPRVSVAPAPVLSPLPVATPEPPVVPPASAPPPEPIAPPGHVEPPTPSPWTKKLLKFGGITAGGAVLVGLVVAGIVWWRRPQPSPAVTPPVQAPTVSVPATHPEPEVPKAPVVPTREKPHPTVAAPASNKAKENPRDGLMYVWIPPGSFMMGCSPDDNQCQDDERPAHLVSLPGGFWLGQTEVTVGAYKRFAAATGRQMPPPTSFDAEWTNDRLPIVMVTWDDAREYCAWAGMRLPTEAEWEYAARGGSTEPLYGPLDRVAWHGGNAGGQPHPGGEKQGNAFQLYDMLGNAWEWVYDRYDPNYYKDERTQDPAGPSSGQDRVLRGGSWYDPAGTVRVSRRNRGYPGDRDGGGIRCAGALPRK